MYFCQPQILGDHEVIESLHTNLVVWILSCVAGKFGVVWLMSRV